MKITIGLFNNIVLQQQKYIHSWFYRRGGKAECRVFYLKLACQTIKNWIIGFSWCFKTFTINLEDILL